MKWFEDPLTFARVSRVNRKRCKRWHANDNGSWSGADWSNAMCGEAGEVANVVKKLRRIECGTPGSKDPPTAELHNMLADEIADTYLYLDLLADHYGIDVADAIIAKFNKVSVREGFPDRLPNG